MHGRNHTKLGKPSDIRFVDDFDVFNAMTAVTIAVGLPGRLIAVQGTPYCRISDGVDRNLKPASVTVRGDLVEFVRTEQGITG